MADRRPTRDELEEEVDRLREGLADVQDQIADLLEEEEAEEKEEDEPEA